MTPDKPTENEKKEAVERNAALFREAVDKLRVTKLEKALDAQLQKHSISSSSY